MRSSGLCGFLYLVILIVYPYLKTVIIMAKFDLKFIDCVQDDAFIKVCKIETDTEQINNIDVISITGMSDDGDRFCVWLDKSTAIKFAKTLRTEINKITGSEVYNG